MRFNKKLDMALAKDYKIKHALLVLKEAMDEDYIKACQAGDEVIINRLNKAYNALSKLSPIF